MGADYADYVNARSRARLLERQLAEADRALAWCYHIAAPFGAKWKADEEYAHVLQAVDRHRLRQEAIQSLSTP